MADAPRPSADGKARRGPQIYSIAAHRGFADALVAGLLPRYREDDFGLAQLTLLLPSTRAVRTVTQAFVRQAGEGGLLLPRMAVVGDLDLDETLGSLLDPLGAPDIPPAVDSVARRLALARIVAQVRGDGAGEGDPGLGGATLLRMAGEIGAAMDRLIAERVQPEELLEERVLRIVGDVADHWKESIHLFASVQRIWLDELQSAGMVDAATRRNLLFDHAARSWKAHPPEQPIVAAGVTSAAPALADLLRVVADLPRGAVILPDFDLTIDEEVWDELGSAGAPREDGAPFAPGDAVTHPQYHLKLLLNRMGIAREEVDPWHRSGMTASRPERSHAIGNLFLPPQASRRWVDLAGDKRRLAGVTMMEAAHPEEEAQAIALRIREALEVPEKRVALVTPDRTLAQRVIAHLRRWNIEADDSAGRPLDQTAAGRLLLLLAEIAADDPSPVALFALLAHPLVQAGNERAEWLDRVRRLEKRMRGPREAPGMDAFRVKAAELVDGAEWWQGVEALLAPVIGAPSERTLADWLSALAQTGEALCGEGLWARADGRALSQFVENWRTPAAASGHMIAAIDLLSVLRDLMAEEAVRPPYGGHPRVAIYGLLESRMTRADLVICGGLNEGTWPAGSLVDPLLPAPVLRALGVPGGDFRIGLSAHDLAAALGAPEVLLSRARRDLSGPTIPSRFLLRIQALLGTRLASASADEEALQWARAIDYSTRLPAYPRPAPQPGGEHRTTRISVTSIDRLRSDPYQYYASHILRLSALDALDAEPTAAWKGKLAHDILDIWQKEERADLREVAEEYLAKVPAHPLTLALWKPRLMRALEWIEREIVARDREVLVTECKGEIDFAGITVSGQVDRIDRQADGTIAIVDYKTGTPPSAARVAAGYTLQLGTLGMMAERGAFDGVEGEPTAFEYWSLARNAKSETGFGHAASAVKIGRMQSGLAPEEMVRETEAFVRDAIERWLTGNEPFTARLNPDLDSYADYDQLMRLQEWFGDLERGGDTEAGAGS
jgi:ATP-dependent helicase/nuclease subunit B